VHSVTSNQPRQVAKVHFYFWNLNTKSFKIGSEYFTASKLWEDNYVRNLPSGQKKKKPLPRNKICHTQFNFQKGILNQNGAQLSRIFPLFHKIRREYEHIVLTATNFLEFVYRTLLKKYKNCTGSKNGSASILR